MSDTPRVGIEVAVDGSAAEAGLARVDAAVTRTGRTLESLGDRGAAALDNVGAQSTAAATRTDAATRSIVSQVQRQIATMEAGERGTRSYYEAMTRLRGANADALRPLLDQLDQVNARQAAARTGLAATSASLGQVGVSAAQTAAAMRGVPAQITDIVTSLQGGQAPLTVFLQQGGQLRDMFGSAGGAARGLASGLMSLVNPYTLLAAAAVAVGVAYNQGSKEADAYNRALIMTGNAAGTTAGQLADMARGISTSVGTQGEAAAALAALAGTGAVAAGNLQQFGEVAVRAQKTIGTSVEDTAKAFADLAKSPLAASEKLNDQYRYLTVAIYDQIKALEQQGRTQEAGELAQKAYADAMSERTRAVTANLGSIERAWDTVTGVAKKAWDSMLNVGREETLDEKLADVADRIAKTKRRLTSFIDAPDAQRELVGLRAEQELLQAQQREQSKANDQKAAANQLQQAAIEWSKEYGQHLDKETKHQNELAAARKKASDASAGVSDPKRLGEIADQLKAVEADISAQYAEKSKARTSAVKAEVSAYGNLTAAIGQRIDATAREAAGLKPLTESQRLQVALDEGLASGKIKLTAVQKAAYEAQIKTLSVNEAVVEAQKRAAQGNAEVERLYKSVADERARSVGQAEAEAERNEELVRTFGLTKSAIAAVELARLEEQLAQRSSLGLTLDEIEHLERLIDAKKRSAAALETLDAREAGVKAAKDTEAAWERTSDHIEEALTDSIMRGFESGKSLAENLRDTTVNMFKTMVLRPTIKGVFTDGLSGGTLASGAASASGGLSMAAGSAGSLAGMASLLGSAGSIGTGALQTAGALFSGQIGFGSTLSAGLSAIGTGSAAGISAGLSSVLGTLGPIALGVGAILAISKKLDDSGTKHTGGGSTASAAGVSSITDLRSVGFAPGTVNASATQEFTAQIAQTVVKILDSTATTFGKTAGYTAATAFADDTSKDGAWGSLLIKNIQGTLVDWNSNRTSGWAPREYADGKAGQEQYIAELAKSVRGALDQIGVPGWAQSMLDSLGSAPTLEQLAAVVDQINATQLVLSTLGKNMASFAGLSDAAASALIAASGGIAALSTNASAYYDNFYSEAEKNQAISKQVAASLQAVNLTMPTTREAFRAMVEEQLKLGAAGAPAVAALLGVSGAFAQIVPAAEKAAAQVVDLSGARADLEGQLYDLTHTAAEATARQRQAELAAMDASLRPLQERIYALQDEKAAGEAATEAVRQRAGLEGQIYDLTHTAAEATARMRQEELAAMDAALRPMQERIYALQDEEAAADAAAEVARQRAGLEGQIYDLTHTSAEATTRARQLELAALDASLRPLQERLYALQDEKAAAQVAAEALKKAKEAAAETLRAQQQALEPFTRSIMSTMEAARSASKALQDYRASLLVGDMSPMSAQQQVTVAREQFEAADSNSLQAASSTYLEVLKSFGVNSLEYAKGFSAVQTRLSAEAGQLSNLADGLPQLLLALQRITRGVNGSHATGLDSVPFDGYRAELHRGEKVLTSAEANDYRGGAAAIKRNNELLERLIEAVETGNKSGQAVADTLRRVTRDGNALKTEPA